MKLNKIGLTISFLLFRLLIVSAPASNLERSHFPFTKLNQTAQELSDLQFNSPDNSSTDILDDFDLTDDDDCDGSFSSHKRISYEGANYIHFAGNPFSRISDPVILNFSTHRNFHKIAQSHFISLRVFKI
jgi:hypothetical protein